MRAAAARDLGIPIVISTDSHSVKGFDVMQYGVFQARRAGLEKKDVANTRPFKEFKKLLRAQVTANGAWHFASKLCLRRPRIRRCQASRRLGRYRSPANEQAQNEPSASGPRIAPSYRTPLCQLLGIKRRSFVQIGPCKIKNEWRREDRHFEDPKLIVAANKLMAPRIDPPI